MYIIYEIYGVHAKCELQYYMCVFMYVRAAHLRLLTVNFIRFANYRIKQNYVADYALSLAKRAILR